MLTKAVFVTLWIPVIKYPITGWTLSVPIGKVHFRITEDYDLQRNCTIIKVIKNVKIVIIRHKVGQSIKLS